MRGRKYSGRCLLWTAVTAAVMIIAALGASLSAAGTVRARPALSPQCGDPYSAARDPSNPLMLRTAPGPNPLTGAQFFVDGPAHGSAANAIATLVGLNPKRYPDDFSWLSFEQGPLHAALATRPSVTSQVNLLEKIAGQPETQRLSSYARGGGPGAVYDQAQKLFCHNFAADPGSLLRGADAPPHPSPVGTARGEGASPLDSEHFVDKNLGSLCLLVSRGTAAR